MKKIKSKRERTSLFDDVEGAMNNVVELEGIVSIREALYVKRIVLFGSKSDTISIGSNLKSEIRKVKPAADLVPDDGDANDHL